MKQETLEDIAKWVIEFRFTKNEYARVSDSEMYHTIIEKVAKWQQERSYSEEDVKEIVKIAQSIKNYGDYKPFTFEECIEQFKKK